jgi:hypothetical protein
VTRAEKLALHLEMVIWGDMPGGTRLTARQVKEMMAVATEEQKRRAYKRAMSTSPMLLEDER